MLQEQRRAIILDIVDKQGIASIADLVGTLGASVATVRRDLTEMASSGMIRRTHGGALSASASRFERSYDEADVLHVEAKREIARTVADLVTDGDTVLLDSGTTTEQIARALADRDVTIITNSAAIPPLDLNFAPTLHFTGGMYRAAARSSVGPQAESAIRSMRPDKAFIAANGVYGDQVMTPDISEASVKRVMLEVSRQKFLVVDHTKFGQRCLAAVAPVQEFDAIITDSALPVETRNFYRSIFVPVINRVAPATTDRMEYGAMDTDQLLKPSGITLELQARDRDAAVRELIRLLVSQGATDDPEELFRAVLRREAEFSTSIGLGIAIPHAKSSAVTHAAIAFGRSTERIKFSVDDAAGANLIFLIAVPDRAENDHLRILAQISRKLVHKNVRDALLQAKTPEAIVDALR